MSGNKVPSGVKTGLVLEGGGLRGVYNAGVLDRLMEMDIEFEFVIGSSAGAANAGSFISRQRGRTKRISINHLTTPRFFSIRNLFRGRPYMDLDYLYTDVTLHLDPLDLKTLKENPAVFEVTATDMRKGRCVYFNKDRHDIIKAMWASCALPLMGQKPVKYMGYELLDGALSDPIPVKRAVKKGCKKIVVVLTREKGYRKKPGFSERYLKFKYARYERFVEMIQRRYSRYNKTLEYIENPPEGVEIFPIYPSKEPLVGRLSRDKDGLKKQWEMGYKDAKKLEKKLVKFLNHPPER